MNKGTARKKVRQILSSRMIAVFLINRIWISSFVSRLEEYASRKLDKRILDPDPKRIYMKRELHHMNSKLEKSVGNSTMASLSTQSPVSQWKLKISLDGWASSLEKGVGTKLSECRL